MNSSTQVHVVLLANTAWYLYNFRSSTLVSLLNHGYRVTCVAPSDEYVSKIIAIGVEFVPLEMENAGTRTLKELKLLWSIRTILRSLSPDMIFNFTIKLNVYAGLCARHLNIPYINNISGLGTAFIHTSPIYKVVHRLYGIANKGAERVFFQNSDDLETFLDRGLVDHRKAVLLPGSGVNIKHFEEAPIPQETFTFLMIARLIADKGVREFVQAATAVKEKFPEVKFVLLGPGDVQNKSAIGRDEIHKWYVEGIVELPGAADDVRPWLRACHVFVLPSYREGMPRTVLEAAAMGRPAIVTDVPGCRQSIVPGETGWLCEVRDAGSLAKQMISVMGADVDIEAFGKKAAARVQREFSEDIVVQAYLDCVWRLGHLPPKV